MCETNLKEIILLSLLMILFCGCERGDPVRDATGVENILVKHRLSSASEGQSEVMVGTRHQNEEMIATNALEMLFVQLRSDFSRKSAAAFSSGVSQILKGVRDRDIRERIFIGYNDRIWSVMMPRLAVIEKIGGDDSPAMESVVNDFDVMCVLIEYAWNLGAESFVEYPLAIDDYELGRIDYARQESARWEKKGRSDLAKLHNGVLTRLVAMADAPSGPVKASFLVYCSRVDASVGNSDRLTSRHGRLEIKMEMLEKIKKHLGRYPRWAEGWMRKNREGE